MFRCYVGTLCYSSFYSCTKFSVKEGIKLSGRVVVVRELSPESVHYTERFLFFSSLSHIEEEEEEEEEDGELERKTGAMQGASREGRSGGKRVEGNDGKQGPVHPWGGGQNVERNSTVTATSSNGSVQRMERFFVLENVPKTERMKAVLNCYSTTRSIFEWYQWWITNCVPNPNCVSFKGAILMHFQEPSASPMQNPYELLIGLEQEGSVRKYRQEFEAIAGSLNITLEPIHSTTVFLKGLKDEVRDELRDWLNSHPSASLTEIMDLAQSVDENNKNVVWRMVEIQKRGKGSASQGSHCN